jgi:hypothetical protein
MKFPLGPDGACEDSRRKPGLPQPPRNFLHVPEVFSEGAGIYHKIIHEVVHKFMFEVSKQRVDNTWQPTLIPIGSLVNSKRPKGVQKAVALRLLADSGI